MTVVFLVGCDEDEIEGEATALARAEIGMRRFETIEAACDAARESPPTVVLLDARTAGDGAGAAIDALRRAGAGAPVMIVARALERERWERSGADGFVASPVTEARLVDLLKRRGDLVVRGGARASATFRVELSGEGIEIAGYTHDLGADGLLLHAKETLVVGAEVEVRFGAPFHAGAEPFEAKARVVRVAGGDGDAGFSIALQFTKAPAGARRALARFLREREGGGS